MIAEIPVVVRGKWVTLVLHADVLRGDAQLLAAARALGVDIKGRSGEAEMLRSRALVSKEMAS
jgi:hypothetical protein